MTVYRSARTLDESSPAPQRPRPRARLDPFSYGASTPRQRLPGEPVRLHREGREDFSTRARWRSTGRDVRRHAAVSQGLRQARQRLDDRNRTLTFRTRQRRIADASPDRQQPRRRCCRGAARATTRSASACSASPLLQAGPRRPSSMYRRRRDVLRRRSPRRRCAHRACRVDSSSSITMIGHPAAAHGLDSRGTRIAGSGAASYQSGMRLRSTMRAGLRWATQKSRERWPSPHSRSRSKSTTKSQRAYYARGRRVDQGRSRSLERLVDELWQVARLEPGQRVLEGPAPARPFHALARPTAASRSKRWSSSPRSWRCLDQAPNGAPGSTLSPREASSRRPASVKPTAETQSSTSSRSVTCTRRAHMPAPPGSAPLLRPEQRGRAPRADHVRPRSSTCGSRSHPT